MPPRFYCQTKLPRQHFPTTIALDDASAGHVRVLRLREGDAITLFNGDALHEGEATAFIKIIDKRSVSVEVSAWRKISRESPLNITLIQSLATGDKMDLIIQKAVELGVSAIVPIRAQRSTLKLDAERAEKRVTHWQGVAIAACEQCGRNVVPMVSPIQSFDESLAMAGVLGILHPEVHANAGVSLSAWALKHPKTPLSIMVGPEGGFTDIEIAAAVNKGAALITLGTRVLRTETAGLAAISILQAAMGDLAA
jgi:16S rRNA (uracil1498-N3)-methyltransferase